MFRTFFRNASRITNVKPPVKMEIPVEVKHAARLYIITKIGKICKDILDELHETIM